MNYSLQKFANWKTPNGFSARGGYILEEKFQILTAALHTDTSLLLSLLFNFPKGQEEHSLIRIIIVSRENPQTKINLCWIFLREASPKVEIRWIFSVAAWYWSCNVFMECI